MGARRIQLFRPNGLVGRTRNWLILRLLCVHTFMQSPYNTHTLTAHANTRARYAIPFMNITQKFRHHTCAHAKPDDLLAL